MNRLIKVTLFSCISALLSACGGGGGSDSGSTPGERPAGSATGIAHDGPIVGGTVTAFAFDNGTKGASLGTAFTDSRGEYQLAITSPDRPILLEVTGGSYVEEGSGRTVSLGSGDSLQGVIFYESGSTIDAQLTIYTHWAACLTRHTLANSSMTVGNAITQANETLSNIAGVAITATAPIDITKDTNVSAFITPGHQYGYALAAFSGLTADIAEDNEVLPHSSFLYTTIHFTGVVCQDIEFDGDLDGFGEPSSSNPTGRLFIGTTELGPDLYRTSLAQNILEIADNDEVNKAGFTPNDLLDYANGISLNGNNVYGSEQPRAVDIEGPAIVPVTAEDSAIGGTVDLAFDIVDPLGLSSVEFFLDDVFFQTGNPENPVMSIITPNFTDGVHTIKVVAQDILNNETTSTFDYIFENSGAVINITSELLTNTTNYLVTGTYESAASALESITLSPGDVVAQLDTENQTWSATVSLSSGINTVTATALDDIGNTTTDEVEVGVDLLPPTVAVQTTNARFTTFQGQLNLCTSGQLGTNNGADLPVCLDSTKLSLNGQPVTSLLTNDGFTVVAIGIGDSTGSGVFTDDAELLVEYQYRRDGQTVIEWTEAPRPASGSTSDRIFLPIVTEYLGSEFFQTDTNQLHLIDFRVFDEAGNNSDLTFELKFDVLTPELSVSNPTVTNSALFSVPFSSRNLVNGATANVEYIIDNDTSVPFIAQFSPANNHGVTQEYEGAQRENRARTNSRVEWRGRYNTNTDFDDRDPIIQGYANFSYLTVKASSFSDSVRIDPPSTTGSYSNVNSDNLTPPSPTNWSSYDSNDHTYCSSDRDSFGGGSTVGHANGQRYTTCFIWDPPERFGFSEHRLLEHRTAYSTENAPGYPRNNFRDYQQQIDALPQTVIVTNSTAGVQILPTEGFYKIPANTVVTVTLPVRMPVLTNYNDTRVSENASNVPYTSEVFLDKEITWEIDMDMTVVRGIDPGTNDFDSISTSTQLINVSPAVYSVSR